MSVAVINMPGVQNPHCSAWCVRNASWSGFNVPDGAEAFDGLHAAAVGLHGKHQARAHTVAVDQHGAGAADAVLAADMRAGEPEFVDAGNRPADSRGSTLRR